MRSRLTPATKSFGAEALLCEVLRVEFGVTVNVFCEYFSTSNLLQLKSMYAVCPQGD